MKLVHGMLSQMREGGPSCKGLEVNGTEKAVVQDASNAKVMNVQNIRNKWEHSVMRKSIKGPKYRDATFH